MKPLRIRLFFEWGGGALWCGNDAALQRFDVGPIEDRLGLPADLLARIDTLSTHHDTALNWEYPPDPGPWSKDDYAEFCQDVEALRVEIAEALGSDFEVVNEQFDCPT